MKHHKISGLIHLSVCLSAAGLGLERAGRRAGSGGLRLQVPCKLAPPPKATLEAKLAPLLLALFLALRGRSVAT